MPFSTETRENREFAYEIKFLITAECAGQVRAWARARMGPDPNAEGANGDGDTYRTTSLYFDTQRFDVFEGSGSFSRAKYRIRRYGLADGVYLERKLKTGSLVAKRRSSVPIGQLERLSASQPEHGWAGYWFHRRMAARQLAPVCQISYKRMARVSATGAGLARLTLDQDIRAARIRDVAFRPIPEGVALLDHRTILELKYRLAVPVIFKELMEKFRLNPQPVSKYRLAMPALGYVAAHATDATSDWGHRGARLLRAWCAIDGTVPCGIA
jgi:VTC domain